MFGRGGRADPQPTEHVSVLLASTGGEFRPESIALSASLANRSLVGVLISVSLRVSQQERASEIEG